MTRKTVKMFFKEAVHLNQIKLAPREKVLNSQKCLISLYVVGWVINCLDMTEIEDLT